MSNFFGKKVLCFIALPHHNRFLVPIMEALQSQGMSVGYFTAAAEGAFEITLNQAGLPYKHLMDYADAATARDVAAAWREVRAVLLEKVLGNRILQSVPIVIQDKVTRGAIESFFCIQRMLEIEKPDLLFALHELNPWGKMLGYLSHTYRIPYFTLQEGLYYSDLHYYRFHTDYSTACLVWGDECRQILLRAGCADDKIYPIGNTHIWEAKKSFTTPEAIRHTKEVLGIGADKRIILFMMSHSHYQPFEAQDHVRWMSERGDIVTVFKWHPATGKEVVDQALKHVKSSPSVISVHDFDTYALIGASDVCITVGNSTTGLESLVYDKPLIEVRLPDQPYSYSALGVAEQAFGFEDIYRKAEEILTRGITNERRAHVDRYLSSNFAHRDYDTMTRIVSLVKESLKARAARPKPAITPLTAVSLPCSIILPLDEGTPVEIVFDTLRGIADHAAPELYEILIVSNVKDIAVKQLLESLEGDVKILMPEGQLNYAKASNYAAARAQGKYLAFLKPGMIPGRGWLEGLLQVAEQEFDVGVVGGRVLDPHGLLWHIGVAFDVNQSPFSLYRYLPSDFSGALKKREFKAVEFPYLVSRELFCHLGGFDGDFDNRFEDIDLCLAIQAHGLRAIYTPESTMVLHSETWRTNEKTDYHNRIRFYSKWSGALWQDEHHYLNEDGLTHDSLSALYRYFADCLARDPAQRIEASAV